MTIKEINKMQLYSVIYNIVIAELDIKKIGHHEYWCTFEGRFSCKIRWHGRILVTSLQDTKMLAEK